MRELYKYLHEGILDDDIKEGILDDELYEGILDDELYEGILDDEDVFLDNMDKSLLIGGYYDIDVNSIQCDHWRNIYKVGILKAESPINLIDPPKINKFDDPKTNKLLEVLCKIILNLPVDCLDDRIKFYNEASHIFEPYEKYKFGMCHIRKSIGGQIFFYVSSKSIRVDIGGGVKTYVTPHITIPIIKK